MAIFHINSDSTDGTSQTLLGQVQELISLLTTTDGQINGLLADGYQTPEAEKTFRPFFEEYKKNYTGVKDGLEGIAQYLKTVGNTFGETDTQLGAALRG